MKGVFRSYGLPSDIVLDRGPQFISKFWQAFSSLLGASANLSSGYHPQTNGQSERLNQELKKGLRYFVSQTPSLWSKQCLAFAHNSLRRSISGLSPV